MPPLAAAALIVLFEGLSFGIFLPVVGLHCARLGGGPALVGLMFALVSGPKIVTNPWLGQLSDRLGRKPVLLLASLGTLAGSIGWALGSSLVALALARTVTGIFSAQAGLAQAVSADASPPQRRAAAAGVLGAAFAVAFTLGPLLGGWVSSVYGTFAVGWTAAALQALSLIVILLLLEETLPPEARGVAGRPWLTACFELLRERGVAQLLLITIVFTIASSELMPTYELVMRREHGFRDQHVGWGWALFGLVGLIVQGALIRTSVARFGERAVCQFGLALSATGFAFFAFPVSLANFWIGVVLIAVGLMLVTPTLAGMLSRAVGVELQGNLAGMNQAVLGMGRASGNGLGGVLYRHSGSLGTFLVAAALTLLSLALLFLQHRGSARTASGRRATPGRRRRRAPQNARGEGAA
jgi:predicted MFS family arabinose efflux permease